MMADATNNNLMMITIKMMMMMTLEHPGLPRATRPILNSIRMWGGSASHDLEGSSEHDHGELRISRKNC